MLLYKHNRVKEGKTMQYRRSEGRVYLDEADIKRYNAKTTELISLYLNLTPDAITPDMVMEMAEACGFELSRAYSEILAVMCGLDTAGRDRALFRNYFIPMVKLLDPTDYENDPYYKNISFKPRKIGRWELKTMKLKSCEAFICDDFAVTESRELIPKLGFFMREFEYPAILEDGREWMTLLPNETVTTLPAVKKAHGKVLTYGVGLGYFAYMCQRKPEVESVTIVELSADAAEMFKTEILPQFEHPEKVNVIVGDAIEFAEKTAPSGDYDFIFADIWHDVGDGRELYLKFKSFERLYPASTEFEYWLEASILCYIDESLWK